MRNVWVQTDYPFATWVADVTAVAARPDEVLRVVLAILDAGARHRVFLPVSLPAIGYQRDQIPGVGSADFLKGLLAAEWKEHQVVNAFAFTGAAMAPGAP